MYVPAHFKEDSPEALHAAIRDAALATLVTQGKEGMEATHLPMLLDPSVGPQGALIGHLSRGNPQWRNAATEIEALAIFLGPQAYITPSWYATKRETGKVVPTWNYLSVHAYGRVRFIDDAAALLDIVTRLTNRHEAGRDHPWAVSDAPPDFVQAHLKGIVGVELTISRLVGSRKMSQNRPPADRAGVVAGLRAEGSEMTAAVSALVGAKTG